MLSSLSSKIIRQIKSSRRILLHLHPAPDGDSLGSALAFWHFLMSLKKEVVLIKGDSELPQDFACLPGFDQISPINFFDLDLPKFDLFISLDSSDLNQISKLSPVVFPSHLATINIDHHSTNTRFAQINLVDTSSPATSQILYLLFKRWRVKITKNIAINLFVGLYTDTGFKYYRTTSTTFRIASKLVKICPSFTDYIFQIENNNRPEQLKFQGLALLSIETYFSNRLALSVVSFKTLQQYKISPHDTEKSGISNILKSVTGWEIGASLIEVQPELCCLSLRTRDPKVFDVSIIASLLGGGGHTAAAGATLYLPLNQARKHLLQIIQKTYPNLGQP